MDDDPIPRNFSLPLPPGPSEIPQDIRAPQPRKLNHWLSWRGYRTGILLGADMLALAIAWQFARYLNQFYSPLPAELDWWTWLGLPSLFWIFAVATLLLFAQNGLYGQSYKVRNYVQAGQLVTAVYLFSLVLAYFYDPKLDPPRSLFFTAWFSSILLVVSFRLVAAKILGCLEQHRTQVGVFLIAPAYEVHRLSQVLQRRSHYRVVGAALSATAHSNAALQAILDSKAQIVLAEDLPDAELASSLYWKLRRLGVTLQLIPSSRDMLFRRGLPEVTAGIPTLRLDAPLIDGLEYRVKRCLDYVGAGLGLLGVAPLLVAIAIAIKLDSPGPVFFRQERTGLHGKVFQVWKFRTMTVDASHRQAEMELHNETTDGVLFKMKHDPRVTRVGQFLRRTSLDELPQLFNVLLGQMSLVGPRPLPLRDVAKFDSWHHIRHQVLPGMTGLWQISGRSDIESFDDAARLDLHYIDNWCLNLDLEILMETLRIVVLGKGAY